MAAPPMSFFIWRIELPGLRFSPPESKHTPLPTSTSEGASGGPQVSSITLDPCWLAAPTAWIQGKSCSSLSLSLTTCRLQPNSSASSRAFNARLAGIMSDAGVLIRSRLMPMDSTKASTLA